MRAGNDLLASMFLSTWSGMTTEGDVPLATDSTHTQKTGVTPAASKAYNAAAYLKNAYFSRLFRKCHEEASGCK